MVQNVTTEGTGSVNGTVPLTKIPEGCFPFPLSGIALWNQPEDLVSYETQNAFKKIVFVYVLTVLFFLSVPLNTVNMIAFWKHGIRERINLCLFSLSMTDLIVISAQFVFFVSDWLYAVITHTPYKMVLLKYVINNRILFLVGFVYVSGFMSTVIALERCLCIVFPLKARRLLKTSTTAVIIAAGHVVILGGFYVNSKRWQIVCMYNPLTGRSVQAYYSSQFYLNNKQLVDVLDGTVFGFLLPGLCLVGVSVSTVVTVVKLRQLKTWRQQSSTAYVSEGSGSKDVTLTRMLVGTNVLFVACTTPSLVVHGVRPFVPELTNHGKLYNTFHLLMTMQQLCHFVNSSFNFFVYITFGTRFRTTVKHMFLECFNISSRVNKDLQSKPSCPVNQQQVN